MPLHEVTTWRDDPIVRDWINDAAVKAQEVARGEANEMMQDSVAAYKRWLTSEIEKLPTAHYPGVGTVLEKSDVLALLEQEETSAPL